MYLGFLFLLTSCFSIETKNGSEAYKYWSGTAIPDNVEVIEGEYYQSPHFTLEFEFFLKFKPTKEWHIEFINQNRMKIDILDRDAFSFAYHPTWFVPDYNFKVYSENDEFNKSRYFVNEKNGLCYLYATTGM